jgi:hypothetical protein
MKKAKKLRFEIIQRQLQQQLAASLKLAASLRIILPPSVFSLVFLFSSCQEASKGCLDAKATNFDVAATKPCEDNCCTYPNLTLQTDYIKDELSKVKLKLDDTINPTMRYKIGLDSIRIIESQFYLSDFQLVTPDNKTFTVIEKSPIYRQKDTTLALKNYALVGRNNGFDFKIGSFNQSGKYSKLQFKVGLNDTLNKADPKKMPTSHPLSIQRDSMYLSAANTYIFNRLSVEKWRTTGKKDTLRFFITTPKDIVIIKDMSFKDGFDIAIPLTINYAKLIEGVNFSDSENSIKEKIVSNYAKVFSIN